MDRKRAPELRCSNLRMALQPRNGAGSSIFEIQGLHKRGYEIYQRAILVLEVFCSQLHGTGAVRVC